VVNPNGVPELLDMLKPARPRQTPLYALPALAERLGVGEIRDQGREPALRLRRLQGAGRRAGGLRNG
jgi:hypothetical protein